MTQDASQVHQTLLKLGLEMEGTFRRSLTWEAPSRVHHSVKLSDVEIGAYTYLAPRSEISSVSFGRYCSIGPYSRFFGGAHTKGWLSSHPFAHKNIFKNFVDYEPTLKFEGEEEPRTVIGHDVWTGTDVIIIPGNRIGNGAVIGAGTVVSKDVPDYAIVVGNPGRIVKYRFDDALIERMQRVRWWRFDMPRLMAENPNLPFDRPEAMLDFIEEREETLPLLTPPGRQLFESPDGLKIRNLEPANAAEDRSVPKP